VALTMVDLLDRTGQSVSALKLSNALGIPVVPVDPRTGHGVKELLAALDGCKACSGSETRCRNACRARAGIQICSGSSSAERRRVPEPRQPDSLTSRIDRFVLHRYLGFPVFFLVLISCSRPSSGSLNRSWILIDAGFSAAGRRRQGDRSELYSHEVSWRRRDCGRGRSCVFFPQIMILFFLMTLLEDSGYLARCGTRRSAAIVSRLARRSFVPMLSGFACANPAVFAARAIPAKRERMLTIWILPLMSCSARLPVYALLLAALLPAPHGRQDSASLRSTFESADRVDHRGNHGPRVHEASQAFAARDGTAGLSCAAVVADPAHDVVAWICVSEARGCADSDRLGRAVDDLQLRLRSRQSGARRPPWSNHSRRSWARAWLRHCGRWVSIGASASD
jgi:Fe2+ transport system protein B